MSAPVKPTIKPKIPAVAGKPGIKRINVALQGGGAHGAFSWGVLDRLLEDERIEIEAISGTSAGAMNGVVVAEGLVEGGRKRARAQLEDFWRSVADDARAGSAQTSFWNIMLSGWNLGPNPALAMMDMWTRAVSPYDYNPLNLNPLRRFIDAEVDFDRVHSCRSMQLFIAATDVRTGQERIFTGKDVTVDSVMASACLPQVFKAVEIGGVPYWDGGFVANPSIQPFFQHCASPDVLLVQINPVYREATPQSAREIADRVNEITFNASLLKELAQVEFVNAQIAAGRLAGLHYREIFLHRIGGGAALAALDASTKMEAGWTFLSGLRVLGRRETEFWLTRHFDDIGHRGTLDLDALKSGAAV